MSIIKRTFLLIIFSCLIFNLFAIEESMVGTKSVRADSIMNEVTKYAKSFSSFVRDFDGEVYIKGTTEIKNSNFVFKVFPDLFPFTKKSEGRVLEILNKVTYTAPNKLCVSPVALHSTIKNLIKNHEDITYLRIMNIFYETSFNDRSRMP